jgi:FemAB-related protein (PEP-CTERM system-associated)
LRQIPVDRILMSIEVRTFASGELAQHLPRWEAYLTRAGMLALSRHPAWLLVLRNGLGHEPFCLEAMEGTTTCGLLPLAYVRSLLFGRFLVSLPYVNYGGVVADSETVGSALVDRAVELADKLRVRYLELRHESATVEHQSLVRREAGKVHMRLPLPTTVEELWKQVSAKVRNQIRKGQKIQLVVVWGRHELLPEFYDVFSRNMRDLGTPVYGQALFRSILDQFPDRAELVVVRGDDGAVAGALILHGWRVSEVPSASSLRTQRSTSANMLMYWHLLERAVRRGQQVFDFGRSSPDSNTYRFKKQWGAKPVAANWQYYLRQGGMDDMRPDNPRFQRFIRVWQRLPIGLTRLIGPWIVRGIP